MQTKQTDNPFLYTLVIYFVCAWIIIQKGWEEMKPREKTETCQQNGLFMCWKLDGSKLVTRLLGAHTALAEHTPQIFNPH